MLLQFGVGDGATVDSVPGFQTMGVTDPAPFEPTAYIYRMYFSHFLSAWGDRMWEFAIALFLIEIWPGSVRDLDL